VNDEQFRVRPRDGLLPVGDEEGTQVVECSGEGALVGRGLRVAGHGSAANTMNAASTI
jgi:hypothetical protein